MEIENGPLTLETPKIYQWGDIATHEIIRGHIPTDVEQGVPSEGWLRVRPIGSKNFVESRNYDINVLSVAVERERFERTSETFSSWDGSKKSSRLTHNYQSVPRNFERRHDTGEHPVLFEGTVLFGRDIVVELAGIHFRSGNILGAVAIKNSAMDDSAPVESLIVDQPTQGMLEQHRALYDRMISEKPQYSTRVGRLLRFFRNT